jgi:GGDEF domain-containing protein
MNNLSSYELKKKNFYSRMYMLPQRAMYNYHDEVVALILQSCSGALSRQLKIENLKNATIIDSLIGCYNRRKLETHLNRNVAGAIRHRSDLSVFMFDLDHFKKVNDTYGHIAGDQVLKEVSSLVKNNMRPAISFPDMVEKSLSPFYREPIKIRQWKLQTACTQKIERLTILSDGHVIKVTVSFGVSELDPNAELKKIMRDADTMLYKAKLNGRNTVMPGLIEMISHDGLPAIKEKTM